MPRKSKPNAKYPPSWPLISWIVKNRAGWRCACCGREDSFSEGYGLTVHHLDMDPLNCDHTNLVALCQRCHLTIQSWLDPTQLWFLGLKPGWLLEIQG